MGRETQVGGTHLSQGRGLTCLRVCVAKKMEKASLIHTKKSVFSTAGLHQDAPGLLVPFSESDLIRSCPCWRLQDVKNGFMTNLRQLTWLFLNISEAMLVLPGEEVSVHFVLKRVT